MGTLSTWLSYRDICALLREDAAPSQDEVPFANPRKKGEAVKPGARFDWNRGYQVRLLVERAEVDLNSVLHLLVA